MPMRRGALPVAQHHRDQASAWSSASTRRDRERASSASRTRFRPIRRSTSARRRLSDRDDRRVHGVRDARHALGAAIGDRARREPRGQHPLGARRRAASAVSPAQAWLMVDVMKDVVRRGTAAGSVGARFRIPPAARPARPTTAPTSGSSATRPTSSPASGWASTSRRRSRRTRRAACSPRRRGPP